MASCQTNAAIETILLLKHSTGAVSCQRLKLNTNTLRPTNMAPTDSSSYRTHSNCLITGHTDSGSVTRQQYPSHVPLPSTHSVFAYQSNSVTLFGFISFCSSYTVCTLPGFGLVSEPVFDSGILLDFFFFLQAFIIKIFFCTCIFVAAYVS